MHAWDPTSPACVCVSRSWQDAVNSRRDKFVPRQKQTTPLEISRAGVFLLSDAASAINAAEIFADGGTHSCVAGP